MQYNPYLVIPFATWIIAQSLKFCVSALRGRLDFKYLYASGGMPSVHSAVVCSLAVTALLLQGLSSPLFGFTAIFAAIVMYDSFGVRRSSGEQAAAINMLIGSLEQDRVKLAQPSLKMREILGHSPLEVSIGAVLGIVMAGLFNFSHLSGFVNWYTALPGKTEMWVYLAVFAVILVAGYLISWRLRHRKAKLAVIKKLARWILISSQVVAWPGLVVSLGQYERLDILGWRGWSAFLIGLFVILVVSIVWNFRNSVPQALAEEADRQRKQRWLEADKRKKRRTKR